MDLPRPLSLMSAVRIQLTMLTSSAPQNAVQKPATWKPEPNTETSHRQKALSTSRKRPRVSSVIGNVSTTRTGRTIALTSPSSNPATTAEASPSSRMPGTTCAASKSPSVYTTIRRMNPMARVRVYTLRVAAGLLLVGQPDLARDHLVGYARRLGLDASAFTECLDSGRYRDAVLAEQREGREAGVRATPTLFINQRKIEGALPLEEFRDAVRQALRDAGR